MAFDTLKLSTRYWVHSSSDLLKKNRDFQRSCLGPAVPWFFESAAFRKYSAIPRFGMVLAFFGMAIVARGWYMKSQLPRTEI